MRSRKLPPNLEKKYEKNRIAIICEGTEEEEYIKKLKSLKIWSDTHNIVLKNAESSTRIFSIYQNLFTKDTFDIILIFCDTDDVEISLKENHYIILKDKIKKHHNTKNYPNIIIFGNPCTMQIVLAHFKKVKLYSRKKTENRKTIKKLTGISDYDATIKQIRDLMKKITKDNYDYMKMNLKEITNIDNICPSTNFCEFLEYFENEKIDWINEINNILNTED